MALILQFYEVEIKCMNFKNKFGGCEYSIKLDRNSFKIKLNDLSYHE